MIHPPSTPASFPSLPSPDPVGMRGLASLTLPLEEAISSVFVWSEELYVRRSDRIAIFTFVCRVSQQHTGMIQDDEILVKA